MDRQRRIARAQELLDDPLVTEMLDRAEKRATDELLKSTSGLPWADRKRRRLIDKINVIRGLRDDLLLEVQMGEADSRQRGGIA